MCSRVSIDPKLVAEFDQPLDALDHEVKTRFRNKALARALGYIAIGVLCVILLTFLEGYGAGEGGYRGLSVLDVFTFPAILLPVYGLLQLATLKNRMTDLARANLIRQHPSVKELERDRLAQLEKRRSDFLKVFTFSFVGILFATTILIALYFTFADSKAL